MTVPAAVTTPEPTIGGEQQVRAPSAAQIARSAILVIGIFTFAKAFSLLEKLIGLNRFGIGVDWDTLTAANQLPEQLYILIAGGALGYAFIPIFGKYIAEGRRDTAWQLASNVLNTVFLAALIVAIVVFFAAPWLIENVIAPGFARPLANITNALDPAFINEVYHPDRILQTANLMRILLVSLILFSISGLLSGILQTHQRFLFPSLTPIFYDIGNLIGVAVLARYYGVYGAAIGAVIGSFLHMAIQIPAILQLRAKWQPRLNLRDPDLREVVRLMIPRAFGLAVANINLVLAYRLASEVGEGSVAALNRGYSLMQIPQTLLGTAIGIVIFPTLAALSAQGDLKGKRNAMSGSLRFILVASIPAAVLLATVGRPLIGILEGGQFDAEGVNRVFFILQLWALGIVTQSGVEVVARSFYADKDMITPLLVGILATVLNIGLALLFIQVFREAGLALANSLAVGVELVILSFVLRRRWKGIDEDVLIPALWKATAAAVLMGGILLLLEPIVTRIVLPFGGRRVDLIAHAGILGVVGLVVYLVAAFALNMRELKELPRLLRARRA